MSSIARSFPARRGRGAAAARQNQPLAAFLFSLADTVEEAAALSLPRALASPSSSPPSAFSSSLRPLLNCLIPEPRSFISRGILPPPPNRSTTTARTMSQCQMLKLPMPGVLLDVPLCRRCHLPSSQMNVVSGPDYRKNAAPRQRRPIVASGLVVQMRRPFHQSMALAPADEPGP